MCGGLASLLPAGVGQALPRDFCSQLELGAACTFVPARGKQAVSSSLGSPEVGWFGWAYAPQTPLHPFCDFPMADVSFVPLQISSKKAELVAFQLLPGI